MVRCPQCGVRLRDEAPRCPDHGPASATSAPAPEAAPPELAATFRKGDLELGPLLGRGGFGAVYAARFCASGESSESGESVVVKLASAERRDAAERLRAEAHALREVGPPHVPRVFQCATHGELTYLVMERVTAPLLSERLAEQSGPLPRSELSEVAHALFDAVGAIHERGLVHLDLKPENVFLDHTRARIIDFGLSAREGAPASEETLGTAEYMAPEQCTPGARLDRRSDLYSLGVLLYELASGAPPFVGAASDVREAHKSARPRPLPAKLRLPRALDEVIRRCLAKDPRRRFDDVAALRGAFDAALDTQRASVPALHEPRDKSALATAAPAAEKRPMALLFFSSRAGLGAVKSEITGARGEIVHQQGSDYVAAFSHDVDDNPVHAAVLAAQRLLAGRTATRAQIDLAAVSVQTRADGSRRIFSALFTKRDRYPSATAPSPIVLTRAAAEVVVDLPLAAIPEQPDRFALDTAQSTHEMTAFGLELAPLIGRDDLLAALSAHVSEAIREQKPTLCTVLGEAGVGKSRVARALMQKVTPEVSPVDTLRFAARDTTYGESKLPGEMLRRALDLPASTASGEARMRASLRERLGAEVGEQALSAALFALGVLDAQHPELRRIAAAPGALRIAVARALAAALRRRAGARPLLLLLDDAHLADDTTLDALELATMDGDVRLAVVTFARPPLLRARPGWGKRAPASATFPLAALAAKDAEALARELLKPVEYIPPDALAHLALRTQGMPALLVELVRGLKREGLVRRSERGTGYYLATDALDKLPDLPIVAWNASREFEALPPQLADHARLAAVLGTNFLDHELDSLLALLEREQPDGPVQLDARIGLDRLVEAGVLVRHRGRGYDFRNALLRDTVYQRIPEARRQRLHLLALRVHHASAAPLDRKLPRIALHAARSGERAIAAHAYLELAQRAQTAHSYLEAEAHYSNALEQLGDDDRARTVEAARGRGLMRFRLGRHEDAVLDLRRARSLAEGELALQILLDEATVLDWMRDFTASTALTEQAVPYEGRCSELAGARIAMSRARVHHRRGEALASVRVGSEAAERALALGDDGYETRIGALLMIAPDSVTLGQLDEARTYFDLALREASEHGDLHHLAAAHVNRALLWLMLKDPEQLFADLARGAQIGRELGAPLIEYPARINMGEVAYALDQLRSATEHTERAIALARQLWGEDNREVCACELLLARIALHRGELEEAVALTSQIDERMRRAKASGSSECEFLPPEQVLFQMVELGARAADDAAWDELEARAQPIDMQPQDQVALLEARALAALRRGEREAARRTFERALELSEALPNLLSERVERRYRALFPGPQPAA